MRALFLALLAAASPAALAGEARVGGFLKGWAALGEDASQSVRQAGLLLKNLRLKVEASPSESVKLVAVPEFAGGAALLDGYVDWAPLPGTLSLRAGQFKFPFGLDRMDTPAQLERADYSGILALFPRHGWDDGVQARLSAGQATLSLAAFEGLGPNLAAPAGSTRGLRGIQEFSGTAGLALFGGALLLGGSGYFGQNAATAAPSSWIGGAHLKASAGALDLAAEWINQERGLWGLTVKPGWRIGASHKLLAFLDRTQDPLGDALGRSSLGGAWICDPLQGLRVTLQASGAGKGASLSPQSFEAIAQVLTVF